MKHRCKLKWTALFLVFVLSISLICNFTAFAGTGFTTVYSNLFEENKTGWHSFFGGTTSLSTDEAFSGSYSLKMTGREKAWYSPGINIYSIIKENGAGTYEVNMHVLATAVDETTPWIGALIRTDKENSFS